MFINFFCAKTRDPSVWRKLLDHHSPWLWQQSWLINDGYKWLQSWMIIGWLVSESAKPIVATQNQTLGEFARLETCEATQLSPELKCPQAMKKWSKEAGKDGLRSSSDKIQLPKQKDSGSDSTMAKPKQRHAQWSVSTWCEEKNSDGSKTIYTGVRVYSIQELIIARGPSQICQAYYSSHQEDLDMHILWLLVNSLLANLTRIERRVNHQQFIHHLCG